MTWREKYISEDYVRCHIEEKADIRFHDGGLPHVIGACCYQVVRAAKDLELSPEGRGFSYNHAGMLAYFNGKFLMEYLGGPRGEHEFPSAVFLCLSEDGIHWEKPIEIFPPKYVAAAPYCGPRKECITTDEVPCIVHHRMGFYTSKSGHLLVTTFYGISPDFHLAPNNGYGVGRVVREIYPDFTMSPVYVLRYNEAGGYKKGEVDFFPWFEESRDPGFTEACRELLGDHLVTQQWWEEERLDTERFTCTGGRALSYYTLPQGRIMGVFKDSFTSYSDDGGKTWSPLKQSLSLETASGKVWGQRTKDGRYALAYNPSPEGAHRWPLAVMWGENGEDFYHLSAIVPEVSPCRYEGGLKNLGLQYMRGITETNRQPDDMGMWLVYSANKEDMWVVRVPVPMKNKCQEDLAEKMCRISDGQLRDTWNLYVPAWNRAELESGPGGRIGLHLTDCDPCNRTKATRMFRPSGIAEISLSVMLEGDLEGKPGILLQDAHGRQVLSVVFRSDRAVCLRNGGFETKLCDFEPGKEIQIQIKADCLRNRIEAAAKCGESFGRKRDYAGASVWEVERLVFETKYELPFQGLEDNGRLGNIGNLPGADIPHPQLGFWIFEVNTVSKEPACYARSADS